VHFSKLSFWLQQYLGALYKLPTGKKPLPLGGGEFTKSSLSAKIMINQIDLNICPRIIIPIKYVIRIPQAT
jgi:hypothetical protein